VQSYRWFLLVDEVPRSPWPESIACPSCVPTAVDLLLQTLRPQS
jgi:hypothetical protein